MAALLFFLSASCRSGKEAFIFTYFDNSCQGAGLMLAVSEDGYQWEAVNQGKPVMIPEVGREKVLRDPSICLAPDGMFHLVWTTGWSGGTIGHATSRDLIHWSDQEEIPVMKDFPSVRNTWAPELFYDRGVYYILWASTVPDNPAISTDGCLSENDFNHRIYMTSTRDFVEFTPTRLYFNPDFNVIDAMVIRVPSSGELVMAIKNENLHPAEKNIRLARSQDMESGFPLEVSAPVTPEGEWSEGPALLYVGKDLLLFYDKYTKHKYGAALSHDDGHTWVDVSDRIKMPEGMSHGTAIAIPYKYVRLFVQR